MSKTRELQGGSAIGILVEEAHGEPDSPFVGVFPVEITREVAERFLEATGAPTITDAIHLILTREAEFARVCSAAKRHGSSSSSSDENRRTEQQRAPAESALEQRIKDLEKKLKAAHWFNERAAVEVESARLPRALHGLRHAYVHAEVLTDGATAYTITTEVGENADENRRADVVEALAKVLDLDVAPDGWPDEPPAERLEELVRGLVGVDITLLKRGRPELADRAEELVKGLGALLRDVLDVPARTATAV